jgi:hypothetical protein
VDAGWVSAVKRSCPIRNGLGSFVLNGFETIVGPSGVRSGGHEVPAQLAVLVVRGGAGGVAEWLHWWAARNANGVPSTTTAPHTARDLAKRVGSG